MLFQKKAIDFIIVGLGNPGKKYEKTRHNVGFNAIDDMAKNWDIKITKSKFNALTGSGTVNGKKVLLVKPQTFMNLSGESANKAAEFYKVEPQNIIVLFDDISLEPGKLRIRDKGSAGGHNGIKSLIGHIGEEFPRVKIGVGEKPHKEYNLADWVLGTPSQSEQKAIAARFDDIRQAVELIMKGQLNTAQSKYNG